MSGILSFINPFNKVIDVVDQFVEDKDKAAELKHQLNMGAQEVYLTELGTKTIPWVDALHKMGRQISTYLSYGLCAFMIHSGITDPIALGACFAPGGLYAAFKNKK